MLRTQMGDAMSNSLRRLLAAVHENWQGDNLLAHFLERFSADRSDSYLGWRFTEDHGDTYLYPDDPLGYLQLVGFTVGLERLRVNTLHQSYGWRGPLTPIENVVDTLLTEILNQDEFTADRARDSLTMLVPVAMSSDDESIDKAIKHVEVAADHLSEIEDKKSPGARKPGAGLSVDAISAVRYVTRELGLFEKRRWNTILESNDLLSGKFDNFEHFLNVAQASTPPVAFIDRQILPPGTRQTFRAGDADDTIVNQNHRSIAHDEDRLRVLELVKTELEEQLPWARFRVVRPDPSLSPRDSLTRALSDYNILVVKAANQEYAVAVSPMAGQDAIYIVRSDVSELPWAEVLTGTKKRARELGARTVRVTGEPEWKHEQAAEKVVAYLVCTVYSFRTSSPEYGNGRWLVGYS